VIKKYYELVKPGIIYGNAITAIAGYFLAARGHGNLWVFFGLVVGISLVMASACVVNNYIDRGIDIKMSRTKKRALVTGLISAQQALLYATALGVVGFSALVYWTNLLTTVVAFVGFIFYVLIYAIAKRCTVHGTLVGSIAGAIPPLAGYCALRNHIDLGAVLVFMILVLWQMPHFYAIALYRSEDYAAADIPVLPLKAGIEATKQQIVGYVVAFIFTTALLTVYGYTGYFYLIVMLIVGLAWLRICLQGFQVSNEKIWGRKVFRFSLIVIMVLSLMLSIGGLIS
jgi:protoheme IX farnesyltransferase